MFHTCAHFETPWCAECCREVEEQAAALRDYGAFYAEPVQVTLYGDDAIEELERRLRMARLDREIAEAAKRMEADIEKFLFDHLKETPCPESATSPATATGGSAAS